MFILHNNGYNIGKAIANLVPAGGPVLCRDEMEEWSAGWLLVIFSLCWCGEVKVFLQWDKSLFRTLNPDYLSSLEIEGIVLINSTLM